MSDVNNNDMMESFDEMLDRVDKKVDEDFEKLRTDLGIHKIIEPVEIPNINGPKVETVEEDIKSPSESVDEFLKPVLTETKEEPLVVQPSFNPINVPTIPTIEEKKEEAVELSIPTIGGTGATENPITVEEDPTPKKTNMPDVDRIKSKSVGTLEIIKNSKIVNMGKELWDKKKSLIIKIALLTTLATAAVTVVPDYAIRQTYKTPGTEMGQFISFSADSEVPETDVKDIGREIADEITKEVQEFNVMNTDPNNKYDANIAVIIRLGNIYEQIVDTAVYSKKGTNDKAWGAGERNDFWLVNMYDVMQYNLRANGIIDLPEKFEDFLSANNLNKGNMNYNPLTNVLRLTNEDQVVSYYDSLDNLEEFSRYLMGRQTNPYNKICEQYTEKYLELQSMYPNSVIRLSNEGLKIFDEKGEYPVYDVVSLNPIVLIESQKNINEEGVTSARS